MAVVAVTRRRVHSHGAMKMEIGNFTADGDGDDFYFDTKLRDIVFVRFVGTSANDIAFTYVVNSNGSGLTKSGSVWINAGASASSDYTYMAIGRG